MRYKCNKGTYIKSLQPIPLDPTRATAPSTEIKLDMLKSKIGQILWVARQSRPDIMCDTYILASNTKYATVQTLHCANKLIRKLKSEEVILRFQYFGENCSLKLFVFSDSSMGNLADGGTQGGHFFMLIGEDGKFFTNMLAVKTHQESCTEYVSRRDIGYSG